MLNTLLTLNRRHRSIKHDSVEASTAQAPLDELQHRRKLRENDRLQGLLLRTKLVQVVHQHLDLGAAGPILHSDAVDDGRLLDHLLILLDLRRLEVDGKWNVAAWAVGFSTSIFDTLHIVLDTSAAEVVFALRSDGLLSHLVANVTNEDVLTLLGMLLEK